jgi:flagellar hook assembly protein FlgD
MTCMFLFIESLVNSTNNNNRVQANKRISRHRLLHDSNVSGNLRGLLERGVQVKMDAEEVQGQHCRGVYWLH